MQIFKSLVESLSFGEASEQWYTRVLICSDVLYRGVDVEDVDCVVNYELPKNDRLLVHRAGRTGRAGNTGEVLSLGGGGAVCYFFIVFFTQV
ncbi:unnamed protein product [Nippostrongylus brasiliensis]|uniref:Putative ATP-dependent RNA helicase (inferred by orthology to a C. elegans protein) n=1 Tax=Nippostrongylus brasiliensis TaxID=27835 RepID=A0A0N4XQR7_NIPBR|nr:unnamed protein product [Nippostrongylus brasiliensis]